MRLLTALAFTGLVVGCDAERVGDIVPREEPVSPRSVSELARDSRPARSDRDSQQKIIAFGDSLTAGFGIGKDEAYPAMLQQLVDDEGYPYEVVNAGVSGETSAGGVRRLSWVLEDRDVVALILELGGNDALRGLPPSEMKKNLMTIIDGGLERGIPVLLAGFRTDSEPSDRYVKQFVQVYEDLAQERDVTFLSNFLAGVAGVADLNQADGKHPNADGARAVAANVWDVLKPMLPPTDRASEP